MTGIPSDPHLHDDAAYVLGALDPTERAAFERHLATCPQCRARIDELAGLPGALATVDDPSVLAEAPPRTLLPGLLRRASVRRRRQRWLTGGLAGVAAACAIALIVTLWPTGGGAQPQARRFTALVRAPVVATATLTAKQWGTEIDVMCAYRAGDDSDRIPYSMVAYPRSGPPLAVGGWKQPGGDDIQYVTGTSLTIAQIAKIEITLPDGTPILRLTN